MELLNGSEEMENERIEMEEKVDLENGKLEKGKIRKALRNIKLKKTAGVDGIPRSLEVCRERIVEGNGFSDEEV